MIIRHKVIFAVILALILLVGILLAYNNLLEGINLLYPLPEIPNIGSSYRRPIIVRYPVYIG